MKQYIFKVAGEALSSVEQFETEDLAKVRAKQLAAIDNKAVVVWMIAFSIQPEMVYTCVTPTEEQVRNVSADVPAIEGRA